MLSQYVTASGDTSILTRALPLAEVRACYFLYTVYTDCRE